MKDSLLKSRQGFTIVELLIVIVVIAILATITIVAYNGIQNQARSSAVQAAARQAYTKLRTYAVQNADTYPATLTDLGITNSSEATYNYQVNNSANPKWFCVTANNSSMSYFTTSTQSAPTAGSCNVTTGLIGWWQLNGNANDAVGSNNGVVGAPLSTGQNGQNNGAYGFNGSNQQITVAHSTAYKSNSSLTLSWWARPTNLDSPLAQRFLSTSEASGFATGINGSSADVTCDPLLVCFFLHIGGSWRTIGTSKSILSNNTWFYFAATYDGSTMRLYVNSQERASGSAAGSITPSTTPLCIGAEAAASTCGQSSYFTGNIDDVRIYNRALSVDEITNLYILGAQ